MSQGTETQKTSGKLPQFRSVALVAVGSNVPFGHLSVAESVESAIEIFPHSVCAIRATSSFYRTAAFPAGSGPDFVNAALAVETSLSPQNFLAMLHDIEEQFGRVRSQRWGPRTLDLDLIGFDDCVLPDRATYDLWATLDASEQQTRAPDELILPHPRLAERAFVLVPLVEVAPDWIHPVSGRSVRQMFDALTDCDLGEVTRL